MRNSFGLWLLLATSTFGQATVERIGPDTRDLIPKGKEVDAIDGDLVLKNDYLTAVVARVKKGRNANMTVRNVSGALIDMTINSRQSDQLSAFYPGRRGFTWSTESFGTMIDEGRRYKTVTLSTANETVKVCLLYTSPSPRD